MLFYSLALASCFPFSALPLPTVQIYSLQMTIWEDFYNDLVRLMISFIYMYIYMYNLIVIKYINLCVYLYHAFSRWVMHEVWCPLLLQEAWIFSVSKNRSHSKTKTTNDSSCS